MKFIGYHRTSTREQHLSRGITEIINYCECNSIKLFKNKVYTDQQTGKNFNRPGYAVVKELLEPGDCLIISEVDRLGRNKYEIAKELRYFRDNSIRLYILEIPTTLVDITQMKSELVTIMMETINSMLIEIFSGLAHAEMIKKEKRQVEGIQAKKDRGEWEDYGRPRKMNYQKFKKEYDRVMRNEIKPFELMKELGLTKSTFYRYKKQYDEDVVSGIEVKNEN